MAAGCGVHVNSTEAGYCDISVQYTLAIGDFIDCVQTHPSAPSVCWDDLRSLFCLRFTVGTIAAGLPNPGLNPGSGQFETSFPGLFYTFYFDGQISSPPPTNPYAYQPGTWRASAGGYSDCMNQ
jgi:hypothetical protein